MASTSVEVRREDSLPVGGFRRSPPQARYLTPSSSRSSTPTHRWGFACVRACMRDCWLTLAVTPPPELSCSPSLSLSPLPPPPSLSPPPTLCSCGPRPLSAEALVELQVQNAGLHKRIERLELERDVSDLSAREKGEVYQRPSTQCWASHAPRASLV
jgi:hypothetical protein